MNTDDTNTTDSRPFGFWVTAVDRLLKAEFATVFADEGVTRRDWRMLNVIDGTVPGKMRPARPGFGPGRGRKLHGRKLHRLIELGWIERTDDGWALTDTGRLAKTRLSAAVDELRTRVAGAVSPEEYAVMTAALEKIAREFGWEEGKPLPRRRGRGRGHGHGHGREHGHRREHGHEHGHRRGHGRDHGHGHGFDESDHRRGHGHGHGLNESDHRRGHGFRNGHAFRGHPGFAPATHIHIHTH